MNSLIRRVSLVFRLGVTATALLLSQQVFATGTTADTDVDNTATVSWSVNSIGQTPVIVAAPTFVVDRRVDFTVGFDGASEVVDAGDTGITFTFPLAHTGNSQLDFVVVVTNLLAGAPPINGNNDTGADVSNVVFTDYYDNVDPDVAPTNIVITGDAAATLANASVANISVTVTAYDPAGDTGNRITLLNSDGNPDQVGVVDNVFADPLIDGLGVEIVYDGMFVQSAALTIDKASLAFWDPLNLFVSPKAIPGSVVEYTIALANTGPLDATGVAISDVVQAPAVFLDASNNPVAAAEPYGTGNVSFFDGTTTTTCLAESGGVDTNADGCVLTGTTLTINPAAPIDVGATTGTMDISFQVLVP